MKLSKILILSLGMALCAGGAIGAAVAFDHTPASIADQTAETDKAVQLYWGSGESEATITNVTNLTSAAQYRFLDVSPKTTKTLSGTVRLTFTLSAYGEDGVLTGLSVEVYEIASNEKNAETIAATIDAKGSEAALLSLSSSSTSGNIDFTVSTAASAHETNKYYAMKLSYDGTFPGEGKSMSGRLLIHQAFIA